jgi:hypothetical protein
VIELAPDSPDVKLKTHTQWAQLNALCRELDIPVRFGLGLSAQKNPKLYFRVIQQTVTYAGCSPGSLTTARPQYDGGGSGYSKAYKLKPHDIKSRPQPLAKKDFWIVRNMQRRDPAAAVFWGSWTECQTERRRRGMCEQTEQTATTMPTSTERRERQALDYEWELLTTDAHHAYRWSCTGSSSLTQTFSFALVESAECNFPDDIELRPNQLQFAPIADTTTEHVGRIPVELPEQTNACSKRRKC